MQKAYAYLTLFFRVNDPLKVARIEMKKNVTLLVSCTMVANIIRVYCSLK
jgi:hypothetical protein